MNYDRIKQQAGHLPAFQIADAINSTLKESANLVVTAPPGAGKSTVLPLTLLGATPQGKILMLEPRRLAARQIAERMASILGEPVGKTVGYRVRFENKVSSETRIEVLTEGILTRMLIHDATLEGVSAVIFDEFHERSINSDLALALTRPGASSHPTGTGNHPTRFEDHHHVGYHRCYCHLRGSSGTIDRERRTDVPRRDRLF